MLSLTKLYADESNTMRMNTTTFLPVSVLLVTENNVSYNLPSFDKLLAICVWTSWWSTFSFNWLICKKINQLFKSDTYKLQILLFVLPISHTMYWRVAWDTSNQGITKEQSYENTNFTWLPELHTSMAAQFHYHRSALLVTNTEIHPKRITLRTTSLSSMLSKRPFNFFIRVQNPTLWTVKKYHILLFGIIILEEYKNNLCS